MRATDHPNYRQRATLPAELRRTTVPTAAREWVRRQTGAEVVRWRRLPGASTSAVHAVRLSDGRQAVLRRWVWPFVLVDEPAVPQRELDALALAEKVDLPAPRVIASDVTGDEVGDGVPAVLMTFVSGRAVAVPDLRRLAEAAVAVHEVDAGGFPHDYFRWSLDELDGPPPTATDPALWERALDLRRTAMPAYEPVFIHRDYHPGNVLWQRGALGGIVDWPNGCRGPWGADVASCRQNLIWLSGDEAADEFQRAYTTVTGRDYHPYWELNRLLEFGADHWTADEVRSVEPWMRRVVAELT